jgi:GNAT superfamily N-acetyltransferase
MSDDDDRTPPKRVRVTGLQEAQIARMLEVDAACAAQYHEIGFDAAEVPVRMGADLARLARAHSVKVAEADHEPAGLLAWRDEPPGVAYLADLQVDPAYQRFGIGSQLLAAMFEEARGLGLRQAVARCWERAPWAMKFYERHGFQPIGAEAPAKVVGWADEDRARPLTRPGEVALWVEIPKGEGDEDEDESDRTSEA